MLASGPRPRLGLDTDPVPSLLGQSHVSSGWVPMPQPHCCVQDPTVPHLAVAAQNKASGWSGTTHTWKATPGGSMVVVGGG
jgi:hypothetical protein